jgi:hypothetical protein
VQPERGICFFLGIPTKADPSPALRDRDDKEKEFFNKLLTFKPFNLPTLKLSHWPIEADVRPESPVVSLGTRGVQLSFRCARG